MASKVDICNMALMRIGVSTIIADINEGSQESNVCAQFFDATLDYILRDYPWNFAEVRVTLAQAAGDPPTNWAFKYAYPSDCLAAIAITIPGLRTPTASARVPFKVAYEPGVGRVIYTDMGTAELVYRARVTDTTMWDPMFVSAFAYLLASEICLPLSVNPAISQQARQAYALVSSSAAARNMSEGAEGPEPPSELIATRNMAVPFSRDSWPYYG